MSQQNSLIDIDTCNLDAKVMRRQTIRTSSTLDVARDF